MNQQLRNNRIPGTPHIQWRFPIGKPTDWPNAVAALNDAIRRLARENPKRDYRSPYAVWTDSNKGTTDLVVWWAGPASLVTRLQRFDNRFDYLPPGQFDQTCARIAAETPNTNQTIKVEPNNDQKPTVSTPENNQIPPKIAKSPAKS